MTRSLGIGLGVFAAAIAIGLYAYVMPRHIEIVRTSRGFEPSEITVRRGDTIIFRTDTEASFWPASDPHPEHTTYAFFDPRESIAATSTWSFTPQRVGVWRFHDHLHPDATGILEVRPRFLSFLSVKPNCAKVDADQKEWCIEESMRETITDKGLDGAFELFVHYYETEPQFLKNGCHWNAHILGAEAYRLFSQGTLVHFSAATSYCGYGFYHGFMQKLLNDNPDLRRAQEFCTDVTAALSKEAPRIGLNCYHGIGHGLIDDPPEQALWGHPDKMWGAVTPQCAKVTNDPKAEEECREGAFNAVVQFMEENKFGLHLEYADLFEWCRKEPQENSRACYYEFAQKLEAVTHGYALNALPIIEATPKEFHLMITRVLFAGMIQHAIGNADQSEFVSECHAFPARFQNACLEGVVAGFRAHGEPGKEYVKGISFCSLSDLTADERAHCFTTLTQQLRTIYDPKKIEEACTAFPEDVRASCRTLPTNG